MGAIPDFKKLVRVKNHTVGNHKGHDRVYLQGDYLAKAGFKIADRVKLIVHDDFIEINLHQNGSTKISKKSSNGKVKPVIDILSAEIKKNIGDDIEVRTYKEKIILRPALSERQKRERESVQEEKKYLACYGGGDLLGYAAKLAGYKAAAIIEHNEKYINVAADNCEDDTIIFNQDVREVSCEDLKSLGRVKLGLFGQPCEFVSTVLRSGKNYKKGEQRVPESHEGVGGLVYPTIQIMDQMNFEEIIVECGPKFIGTASHYILVDFLKSKKYNIHSSVIDAADYGSIQSRKRAVIIASHKPIHLPNQSRNEKLLSEFFDSDEDVEQEWFTQEEKAWLFNHHKKSVAKGNGFSNNLIKTGNEKNIGVLKRRYYSGQGDNPFIKHPTKDIYRWFTINEGRKFFELPDSYKLNAPKTTAGEIMGQGVVVGLFTQIIKNLGSDFSLVEKENIKVDNKSVDNFNDNEIFYQPDLFAI